MRIAYTKERCLKRAPREGNGYIGAGIPGLMATVRADADSCSSEFDHSRAAFGRLVQLSRRKQNLSLEDFAKKVDIALDELMSIERTTCAPEPRTVHKLSGELKIECKKLLQLSGLTKLREPELEREAVLFAARSESLDILSKEETYALEHFVSVLSEKR